MIASLVSGFWFAGLASLRHLAMETQVLNLWGSENRFVSDLGKFHVWGPKGPVGTLLTTIHQTFSLRINSIMKNYT